MDGTASSWPAELHTLSRGNISLYDIPILPWATGTEDQLRTTVALDHIHEILQRVSEDNKFDQLPLQWDIQLGRPAIKNCNTDLGLHFALQSSSVVVAPDFIVTPWFTTDKIMSCEPFSVLSTGWTRVTFPSSYDAFTLVCAIELNPSLRHLLKRSWLSQASWCFKQLLCSEVNTILDTSLYLCDGAGIEIDVEKCNIQTPILPYLFLNRPTGDLVDGQCFARVPTLETLVYWSFNPSGGWKLPNTVVQQLALPQLTCRTVTYGPSWTSSQYGCLREVHAAKGFDPDGPDAAKSLGYPFLISQAAVSSKDCEENTEIVKK
ncbi:hypothetical protein DFH06DRAFT_1167145 [Mycena polygramma]|nr:hypothetical protein DFH06DRAFT_1167145 [Mycena polygramma]